MPRKHVPIIITYCLFIWPAVLLVISWIELIEPRMDTAWWNEPVRKSSRE